MWNTRITVTREQLYADVWAEAVVHVAKRYGVSDRGLRKICDRHHIPVPPLGWWAKKAHGHLVRQTPLPPSTEANLGSVVFQVTEHASVSVASPDLARESDPQWRVDVPDDLAITHPLVKSAENALKHARKIKSEDGHWNRRYQRLLVHAGAKELSIAVSDPLIARALKIMQALVAALEQRGYPVTVNEEGSFVSVMDERYALSLSEGFRQKTVTYAWGKGTDLEPSGRLKLRFGEQYLGSEMSEKSHEQPIEKRLNRFIARMIRHAIQAKADRAAAQERLGRWRVHDHERRLSVQKQNTENLRRKHLAEAATAWAQRETLRRFIKAVEQRLRKGDVDTGRERLDWANAYLAQGDPIKAFLKGQWPEATLPPAAEMPWDWDR